jgi:CrcB protein
MEYLRNCLWIAAGGASGAVFRYLVFVVFQHIGWNTVMATMSVNIVGSFLLGLSFGLIPETNSKMQAFLMIGFMGAFTTFSTFSGDFVKLMESRSFLLASTYAMSSVALGILAFLVGIYLATK